MVRLQVRGEGPARAHVNSLLDRQKVFDCHKGKKGGEREAAVAGDEQLEIQGQGLYKERRKKAKGLFSLGGHTMKYTHQRAAGSTGDTRPLRETPSSGVVERPMEREEVSGGADQVSGPATTMYFRRREEGEAGDGRTRKWSFGGEIPARGKRRVCACRGEGGKRGHQLEVCVRLDADVNDKEDERE